MQQNIGELKMATNEFVTVRTTPQCNQTLPKDRMSASQFITYIKQIADELSNTNQPDNLIDKYEKHLRFLI